MNITISTLKARAAGPRSESYIDALFNVETGLRVLPHISYQQARQTVTNMGYTQPFHTTSELRDAIRNRSK